MLLTSVAELAATGALLICWFQGLSAGNSRFPSNVGTSRPSSSSTCGCQVRRRARATRRSRHQARSQPVCVIASLLSTQACAEHVQKSHGGKETLDGKRFAKAGKTALPLGV